MADQGALFYLTLLLRAVVIYWTETFFSLFPSFRRRKSVSGQLLLITGAGSGLGREAALQFAREGVRLALWDVDEKGLKGTARLLNDEGYVQVHLNVVDVTDASAVKAAASDVRAKCGVPDLLFNNAGISGRYRLTDGVMDEYDRVMNINHRAVVLTVSEFISEMIERNSGHLITTASILSHQGVGGALIPYCASKHATFGFMSSLRAELKARHLDIHTTTIFPGFVKTAMTSGFESTCRFLPQHGPDVIVKEIVDGVLADVEEISVPGWVWWYQVLKGILPSRVLEAIREPFDGLCVPTW